jgi:predicted negative regulator of RcsB-dependent stress response
MQPATAPSPADPILETQIFWDKYKWHIVLAIAAILLATVAVGAFRLYKQRHNASAAAALAAAKTPEDFDRVITHYGNSPAAPSARLLLAASLREQGKFGEAQSQLQSFISNNPKHHFVSAAKMGIAANLESLGNPDQALEMYRRIAADHPTSYNAPFALLAQVPLLKAKDQEDEARRVCETVMTQYRESYAASEASALLRTLKPAATPAPVAPAPAEGATAADAAPADPAATAPAAPATSPATGESAAPVAIESPASSAAPTP